MTQNEITPIDRLLSLEGRTAVVTGGARGIGAGIANRLAEAGAFVVIADLNVDSAEEAAQTIRDGGGEAAAQHLDVTDPKAFQVLADNLEAQGRTATIWVNNAGAYPKRSALELTAADWDLSLSLNLRSAFLGSQTAAAGMIRAGKQGVIVNMASIAGVRLAPTNPVDYAAAKAGVAMLTRNLGVELGPSGIRVVGLAPGFVVTPGVRETPGVNARIGNSASIPMLGRQMVEDDVAKVALFLVSDMASMISSEIVVVDGGGAWNIEVPAPAIDAFAQKNIT